MDLRTTGSYSEDESLFPESYDSKLYDELFQEEGTFSNNNAKSDGSSARYYSYIF